MRLRGCFKCSVFRGWWIYTWHWWVSVSPLLFRHSRDFRLLEVQSVWVLFCFHRIIYIKKNPRKITHNYGIQFNETVMIYIWANVGILFNNYLWLVKINLEHLWVFDYFVGCVRLFVPRTTELSLSSSCNERAQRAVRANGR